MDDNDLIQFKALLDTPGWKIFCRVLDDNIKFLTETIINGGKKDEMDKMREKLNVYSQMRNTPEEMISRLSNPGINSDFDPYEKSERSKVDIKSSDK